MDFPYLLGAVAWTEKITVFPAALEHLGTGTGVVIKQVLLQVFHQAEDQRAAVPLSAKKKKNTFCIFTVFLLIVSNLTTSVLGQ